MFGGVGTDSCLIFLLDKDWDFSSSDIFSGLNIDPNTLVKKLDLDSRSIISSRTGEKERVGLQVPTGLD